MHEPQEGAESLRLFVAAELPQAAVQAVQRWQVEALGGRTELRITRPPHLTLVFLGATPARALSAVVAELGELRFAPIPLEIGGPLALPSARDPRVIALAVRDGTGGLSRLHAEAAARLAGRGLYAPERRRWLPHVTVARCHTKRHPFSLQTVENVTVSSFSLVRMVLYSSRLERTGAVHSPLAVFSAS